MGSGDPLRVKRGEHSAPRPESSHRSHWIASQGRMRVIALDGTSPIPERTMLGSRRRARLRLVEMKRVWVSARSQTRAGFGHGITVEYANQAGSRSGGSHPTHLELRAVRRTGSAGSRRADIDIPLVIEPKFADTAAWRLDLNGKAYPMPVPRRSSGPTLPLSSSPKLDDHPSICTGTASSCADSARRSPGNSATPKSIRGIVKTSFWLTRRLRRRRIHRRQPGPLCFTAISRTHGLGFMMLFNYA